MSRKSPPLHRLTLAGLAVLLVATLLLVAPRPAPNLTPELAANPAQLQAAFAAAAQEFHVPEAVLLAVAYNESRWEHHAGEPSFAGGYGIMHLTDVTVDRSARGDAATSQPPAPNADDPSLHTLLTAARLLREAPATVRQDPVQNIRGGAALLAQYARETTGATPADPADWYGAVAKYSGSTEEAVALEFADQVFLTMGQGVIRITTAGQRMRLSALSVTPNPATAEPLDLHSTTQTEAECPTGLSCRFVPARYAWNDLSDPTDYGNYDLAYRELTMPDVRYIVIHDTEGSYDSAINWFQNRASYVSAHYVIRSSDGQVTQMVPTKDVAWHAGNWFFNSHAIGLEHEGYAIEGASWYTEAMYRSSARLVRYLAGRYHIPLDRAHILGHDEVPGLSPYRQSTQHWDPGPFWDWEHYMELVGAPLLPTGAIRNPRVVTIKPHFATNMPPVNGTPRQPANFLELHTGPSLSSPLLDDPVLPGAGTQNGSDWGDKAGTGQVFYLADHQGDWDAIWFGGQKAWFCNPGRINTLPTRANVLTPKQGKQSIPVYGAAWPEAAAYPPWMEGPELRPIGYTIPAGQKYVVAERVRSDYYDAPIYSPDGSANTEVQGNSIFYRIFFNHRFALVKAEDVDLLGDQ